MDSRERVGGVMVKYLMNDYIMLPFNKNKFIRWVRENELEVVEKKNVHIPNEVITNKSIDVVEYIEEMSKSEIEHYKQQADEYFKLWQEQEEKYNKLTEHIRLKALHNPSISRYKDLMCFINEMEGK